MKRILGVAGFLAAAVLLASQSFQAVRPEDAENNWWRTLWLGPAGKSMVGIGISGKYEDLQMVIDKYGPYAHLMLFPYPKRLGGPRPGESGQLLMIFDRYGLSDAATLKQ